MKKNTLKCLASLIFFLGFVIRVQAQDYTITNVQTNLTDLSSITEDGIPVVLYNTGRTSYISLEEFNSQPTYMMNSTLNVNQESSETFIFWLKKDGSYYKFEDCAGNFIPTVTRGGVTKPSTTAGLYTITDNGSGKWLIKNKDNAYYFNGNDAGQTFTGWDGTAVNSQYEIHPIDINTTITQYTVSYQYEQGTKIANDTTVTSKNHKITFNIPNFYSATSVTCDGNSLTQVNGSWRKPTTTTNTQIVCTCIDDVPFEVSENYATAKWYHIQIHNTDNQSFIQYIDDNTIQGKTKDLYNENQYWCFIGNVHDGYKLYNKKAGANKTIKFAASGNATMTEENGDATLWQISVSNPTNTITNEESKFTLKTISTNEGNVYLNMNPSKVLSFYNRNDDGSTMVVYSVDKAFDEAISEYENLFKDNYAGVVGTVKEYEHTKELINQWKEGPTAETFAQIQELCNNKVELDPTNYYYRIENYCRKFGNKNASNPLDGGYLEAVDYLERPAYNKTISFFSNIKDMKRGGTIWRITGNETDGYKILSLNSKKYLKGDDNKYLTGTTDETEANNLEFVEVSPAQFNIRKKSSTQRLHASGQADSDGGGVMYYNQGDANGASAWFLVPATTIDVEITDALYATVHYPFAVQLPEGDEITAYTASAINGNDSELLLKKVANGLIPANTPVVLQGKEAKSYTLSIVANSDAQTIEGNILEGTTLFEEAPNEKIFVLGQNDGVVGFYKLNDTENANRTITANKAYLPAENLPTPIQATRGFIFSFNDNSDDTTTSIEDVTINSKEEFYDLQGRRVMNPTKGIYVTKSGKKILFTK